MSSTTEIPLEAVGTEYKVACALEVTCVDVAIPFVVSSLNEPPVAESPPSFPMTVGIGEIPCSAMTTEFLAVVVFTVSPVATELYAPPEETASS